MKMRSISTLDDELFRILFPNKNYTINRKTGNVYIS